MVKPDEKLFKDETLVLSNEGFKSGLQKTDYGKRPDCFLEKKFCPTLIEVAELANIVYEDLDKPNKSVMKLPEGWKLLTTARNDAKGNGYFGAAFWHPEHHQIVVAHRGTYFMFHLGPACNDTYGVMYNQLTPQVNSACTFANMMVKALKNEKVHFTFTGHSLGGWLAQITTFTTEYLTIDSTSFRQRTEGDTNYHPHTVAFESPGCMDMLRKVSHSYYPRYEINADDLINDLDIVSYMSVANCINTCRQHAGTIFRIFPELSMNYFERNCLHTPKTHRMHLILETVKNSSKIVEMIDWPLSKYPDYYDKDKSLLTNFCKACVNSDTSEYKEFYNHATTSNDFHPVFECSKREIDVNYNPRDVDDIKTKINVFSKEEQNFMWRLKTCLEEHISRDCLLECLTVTDAKVIWVNDFRYTDTGKEIKCDTKEKLQSVINRTKQLFLWLPQVNKLMIEQIKESPKAHTALYSLKSKENILKYKQDEVHFEDMLELDKFLNSDTSNSSVLHVVASEEYGASSWRPGRICYGILQGLESSANRMNDDDAYDEHCSFLSYNDLKIIASYGIDFVSKFKEELSTLLVLDFCQVDLVTNQMEPRLIEQLSSKVIGKKIIVLTTSKTKKLLEGEHVKTLNVPHWGQLKPYSQTLLLKRKLINFKAKVTSLEESIGIEDNEIWKSIIDSVTLLKLISNEEITVGKRTSRLSDMADAYSNPCKDVALEDVRKATEDNPETGPRFMISNVGILSDTQEWLKESERKIKYLDGESSFEDFKEFCGDHQDETIHWLEVSSSRHARWNHLYDGKFYFERTLVQSEKVVLSLDFRNELTTYIKKDVFVISGILDEESLASGIEIDPELDLGKLNKNIRNESIWMEQTKEDAETKFHEQCDKHKNKKSVHWLVFELVDKNEYRLVWKRSQGSLTIIRQYKDQEKSTNKYVNEDEIVGQNSRVVIIADDPGMGKTTTLKHLSQKIAEPAWVVCIDFNECLQAVNNLPDKDCSITDLISIVDRGYFSSELAKNLFQYDLVNVTSRKVYLIFDGFDEIREERPSMTDDVLKIIKYFKETYSYANIWISTRNHKRNQLEDTFSLCAVSFKGFDDEERNTYLKLYWQVRLTLSSPASYEKKQKIEEFLIKVKEKSENLGSGITQFISIPLQMRMLAEVLQADLEKHIERNSVHDFELKSILDLYQRFIQTKYDVYMKKMGNSPDFIKDVTKCWLKETLTSKHRHLAFQLLCSDDNVASKFQEHTLDKNERNELLCVGLIQSFHHSTFRFVHRTIAEFFTADLLYSWLKTLKGTTAPFPVFLMERALLEPKFAIVRSFLNDLLSNVDQKEGVLWCDPPRLYAFTDKTKQTALHILATENHSVLIDFLLRDDMAYDIDRKSVVDRGDINYMSALHLAAKNGSLDAVKVLLMKKASVNVVDRLNGTPLYRATCFGHEDVVEMLLNNDANTDLSDNEGDTPLHKAASLGHKNIVGMLLEAGAEPDARNNTLQTPLHRASKSGHKDVVEMLLLKPVEVNANDKKQMTPLYWAASKGHANIVNILLRNGAEVNSSDKFGVTPLLVAGWRRQTDVLKLLLSDDIHVLNVDVDAQNNKKEIAVLHYVARAGFVDIVNLLLSKGANVDIADKSNRTPLHFAAGAGNHQVVEALLNPNLNSRANVDAQDSKERTSLHLAAKQGHIDVVRVLLANGANANIEDVNKQTPTKTAKDGGHENICNLLLPSMDFMDR